MTEILRFRDVQRITKMSRATLYRKIRSGELSKPQAINGSPYVVGWHPQVIEDFVLKCLSTPPSDRMLDTVNASRRQVVRFAFDHLCGHLGSFYLRPVWQTDPQLPRDRV